MSFLNAYIVKTAEDGRIDMKICDKDKGMETILGVTHAVTIIHLPMYVVCLLLLFGDDQISFSYNVRLQRKGR